MSRAHSLRYVFALLWSASLWIAPTPVVGLSVVPKHSRGSRTRRAQKRWDHANYSVVEVQGQSSRGNPVSSSSAGVASAANSPASHHSIFELHLSDLDNSRFWCIVFAMILFCVAIDRLQAYCNYLVKDAPSSKLFVERMNAELLLFGVVAITIFAVENLFGTIPEEIHLLIEFADIMCSIGACSLILFAAVIFKILRRNEGHWKKLEGVDVNKSKDASDEVKEYHGMADSFRKANRCKDDVPFYVYLKSALVMNCCDVMNVHWSTWLAFALLPLLGYVERFMRAHAMTDTAFLSVECIFAWILVVLQIGILYWIHRARLVIDARLTADPLTDEEHKTWRVKVYLTACIMHLVSVTTSFQLAFYLMTGIYNAMTMEKPGFWLLTIGLPSVLNIAFLLPMCLTKFVFVQAFFAPDSQTIGTVIEEQGLLAEDLAFLRKEWVEKSATETKTLQAHAMNKDEFKAMLERIHVHVTSIRSDRLFQYFDADESGSVDYREVDMAMKST
jgi:hypothetical protein